MIMTVGKTKSAVAAVSVAGMLASLAITSAGPAQAVPPPAAKYVQYTVCNFTDPSAPTYNPFPFSKDITTAAQSTGNSNVRRAVRSVQELLRFAGYTNRIGGPVLVDGKYGPATAYAVKQFQRRYGLSVTGNVGPKTWKKLGSEYCWMNH